MRQIAACLRSQRLGPLNHAHSPARHGQGLFCAVERQVSKANNAFYRDDFVCCATTPRNVLGIMTLDFYVHTNRAVCWTPPRCAAAMIPDGGRATACAPARPTIQASCVPKSMSDCTRLVQERQDALSKVWCEGVVTVSDGMLVRTNDHEGRRPPTVLATDGMGCPARRGADRARGTGLAPSGGAAAARRAAAL